MPTGRPPTAQHGVTRTLYVHGCRCQPCRDVHAQYVTDWRHRTNRTRCRVDTIRHGISRYRRGCRCDVCRAANAAAVARYRARHGRK
jgi:hypothetical protein